MTYFRLCHDEFSDDRPGLSLDHARGLLARIYERHNGEGRREISADPESSKRYFVFLENDEQAQMLRAFLEKRGIWFEEHDQLPRPKAPESASPDPTLGVIFFLLSREEIQPAAVRGVVHGIAAVLNEMSNGEFHLRAEFIKNPDDPQGTYWVGFNDETAGAIFAFTMREQGVSMPHARALSGGRRPQLQVVNYDESAQLAAQVETTSRARSDRRRREELADPELPPIDSPAMAQGRGFAVLVDGVRKALKNPDFKKKLEDRFRRRERPERPEKRRRKKS